MPTLIATTWAQDKARFVAALKNLALCAIGRGSPRLNGRSAFGEVLHTGMNLPVEATRRDAQTWTKRYCMIIAVGAVLVLAQGYVIVQGCPS